MANFNEVMKKRAEKQIEEEVIIETGKVQQREHIPETVVFSKTVFGKKKVICPTNQDLEEKLAEKEKRLSLEIELPVPPPPPEPKHRFIWIGNTLRYNISEKDEKVLSKMRQFQSDFQIPRQAALRLALLFLIETENDVLRTYTSSLAFFERGVKVQKLCQKSGKIKWRILYCHNGMFKISSKLSATYFVYNSVIDVFPGNFLSYEFKTFWKNCKTDISKINKCIPEDHSCVLKTVNRTYSLIFKDTKHVDFLCALVDLYLGSHGPSIWKTASEKKHNVFLHEDVHNIRDP